MFDDDDTDDISVLRELTDIAKSNTQDIGHVVLRAYWLGQGMPLEDVLSFAPIGLTEKPKPSHLTLVKK